VVIHIPHPSVAHTASASQGTHIPHMSVAQTARASQAGKGAHMRRWPSFPGSTLVCAKESGEEAVVFAARVLAQVRE
jgi:hypothetical protein